MSFVVVKILFHPIRQIDQFAPCFCFVSSKEEREKRLREKLLGVPYRRSYCFVQQFLHIKKSTLIILCNMYICYYWHYVKKCEIMSGNNPVFHDLDCCYKKSDNLILTDYILDNNCQLNILFKVFKSWLDIFEEFVTEWYMPSTSFFGQNGRFLH